MKASAVLLVSAVLGACCVLAAATEPVTWAVANCDCSKERAIVCGADGTSYLNKCWAECSHTTVEHDGPCGKLAADVSASCECSKERALVCGEDGHTYLNKCWAECVDTEVAYEGACANVADVSASCECTLERDLVCGADGHTYLNKCWAGCVDTEVEYEGACKNVADVSASCECSKERALVCGDDGHTYLNKCWAECVDTEVAYQGACWKVADVSCTVGCTKDRALVCGADGTTYLNECWALCSHTDVIHQGPCSRAVEHPPCACTKERDLVCGADGHTYTNACWAACSGTSVSHEGSCKKPVAEAAVSGSCEDSCDKLHAFATGACGEDGKNYASECAAKCAGVSAREGTCYPCPIPPIFAPVCDSQGYTWFNRFVLTCAKQEYEKDGACDGFVPPPPVEVEDAVTSAEPVAEAAVSGECEAACAKSRITSGFCGADGKNYPSQCAAKCAGTSTTREGTCESCPALPVFAPMCDTQGYTWVNQWVMKCAGAQLAHVGPCDYDAAADETVTSANLPAQEKVSDECEDSCDKGGFARAVCGLIDDEEKTYPSQCAAECAGAQPLSQGTCKFCPVPLIFAPVCDTQGYTWRNEQDMKCAGQELAHDGPCNDYAAAEETVSSSDLLAEKAVSGECEDSCDKSSYARPVCAKTGDDEKNYPSECAANCADAKIVRAGTCVFCPVPLIFAPVCDTQGYTWSNEWQMKCAGAELAHVGPCKDYFEADLAADESLTSSECQKACPRVLKPVCGMNNKSYANACRMECDGVELKHDGRCAIQVF